MISIILIVYIYRNSISNYITDNIIYHGSNKILTYNEYYLDNNYLFVQNIDSKDVNNYQDLLNIFYTVINSGDDGYIFNCNYEKCLDDVDNLISDNITISEINNFVHPFNSFSTINIDILSNNKVSINIKRNYNENKIEFVKTYINQFISDNINDNMSDIDKIKAFHDFIINSTVYDENLVNSNYTAYDLIITGKSICGGYSDVLAIYLNMLGIQNYKIASDNHIWNLVKINDKWYHIDMTWDDPVSNDGKQYLLHNFFMITTNELFKLDNIEHNYNKNIYLEAN